MTPQLEVWGGVECSTVRIGAATRSQLHDTGHFDRPGDLDRFAELGIRTLRYPVLWELVEAAQGNLDWTWADFALPRLQDLGVRVIAGLIHHGSGPAWTNVLDPAFPDLLARFAAEVANRYPWIDLYTPVNEPFTTARISGLYGLWHPHGRDEATCFRLTVAQARATAQSMRAIRRLNPAAQLVQTEDFGRIFSTPQLARQAEYENDRRWLSIDLLAGRVDRDHPFFRRLTEAGIDETDLDQLAAEPCLPDIIGIDYYLTSDRFLDERTDRYPQEKSGGNGRESYVDIAAVHADIPDEEVGLLPRLRELQARYQIPIAVTELHNGCTREEQVRWLMEGWHDACRARDEGIDVRSVTSWALLGGVDWNTMLVASDGYYENGAFDVRGSPPHATLVGEAIKSLAARGTFDHPILDRRGWWRGEDPSAELAKPLLLVGFDTAISTLNECCHLRRLRVIPVEAGDPTELMSRHGAWAMLHIESSGPRNAPRPSSLHAWYADGGQFSLETPPAFTWTPVVNAFLDRLMDRSIGRFHLTRADSCNQYECLNIERTAPFVISAVP